MYPMLLFPDIAAARNQDLLVATQQHRRTDLIRHGRSVEAAIRATARRVVLLQAIRGVPEPAAA